MFAAAVWIERPVERHIGSRGNVIDDVLRAIEKDLPFDLVDRSIAFLLLDPLAVEASSPSTCKRTVSKRFPGLIPRPGALMGRAVGKGVAVVKNPRDRFRQRRFRSYRTSC